MSAVQIASGDMLAHATDYAARGWPVFPCGPDKRPLIGNGFKGATVDTAQVEAWWRRWPDAMIGVPMGERSGVFAIDPDAADKPGQPAFKLTIIGNHKPGLKSVDTAARRRFNLVPFTRTPVRVDPELTDKLMAEAPGILRWMIDGCLDWQTNGLVRPDSIKAATDAYFDEQDVMSEWLAEKCIVDRDNGNRNTQQARNLKAAVEALHGPGMWRNFQKTLDVFEAMGRRQHMGSPTEPNRQIAAEIRKGGKLGQTITTALSPSKALGQAKEIYENWKWGRDTGALAHFLTRPDAAKVLGSIAKEPASSSKAQGMLSLYLLNSAANQGRKAIP